MPRPQDPEEIKVYLENSEAGLVDGKKIANLESTQEIRITVTRETYKNLLLLQTALGFKTQAEMARVALIEYYAKPGNQAAIAGLIERWAIPEKKGIAKKVLGLFKRTAREKRL